MAYTCFPPSLQSVQPMERLVTELGFVEGRGGYIQDFDGIEFFACSSLFNWCLIRDGFSTHRTITMPRETFIPNASSELEFLGKVYELWREVFGQRQPEDTLLRYGKEWCDFKSNVKRMTPTEPTVFVDREFFKLCLKQIKRRSETDDCLNMLLFSLTGGQLLMSMEKQGLCCPAEGSWIDTSVVTITDLLEGLPKRFMHDWVRIQQYSDRIVIDSYSIPATWCASD